MSAAPRDHPQLPAEPDQSPGDPADPGKRAEPGPDLARATAELARKTAEFQILRRVSADINSTLDLEEIFDVALRTMDELFEFHHANILLVDPGGETLSVVASRGYENQAIGGRVRIGVGVIGIVAQKRKMLHVSSLGQQRAYALAQRRQMAKAGRGDELGDIVSVPGLQNAESQMAIPLLMGNELIGVFSIESPVRRTFSEHRRDLFQIVANQIASAINNARLYEDRRRAADALQALNASLEARVVERTAALERELRVAQELSIEARSRVDGPLLGESRAVRELREAIGREAARAEPLLLAGPPGAGKEAVAHAVHVASGRRGAFIFVSCPELDTRIRQSSGDSGDAARPGSVLAHKFELASGGTLFLDAIHELPTALQGALLQVLESLEASRSRDAPVPDVRVIASTTRHLTLQAHDGLLDPLFHLLNLRRISVPPLVDRLEDIPVLVDHFVRRQARQLGKVVAGVTPESVQRLQQYSWTGNIRELRSVLERAVLVSRSSMLEIDQELIDEGLAVGSYRLVTRLGSGGMGEVWLAKHRLLARPAAVKLIRHDVQRGAEHEELVRRFQREAQVTAGLRSPHTVQLYDFGVNDSGSFYYVMELLEGLDLHEIVTRFGPQPAERVIMLLRQACRSLAEAHEHGLVHRDIKPANLFVTGLGLEYDYLKVLDFGIVKDRPELESTLLTAQGILQGTPAFMAPELVSGESRIDGRTDLYSIGCVAYWALTGQLLFQANTPAKMLLHHVNTAPLPPSQVSELPIPPELEAIIMMCLEKDPAKRPSSALVLDSRLAHIRIKEPWTQVQAQAWWEAHAPDVLARMES
jgi:eukaryotic-like serine/threonine-protein kinase